MARRLTEARRPLIVVESLGRRPGASAALCRLAELLAAPMIDLAAESQGRPSVPGHHPLDMTEARHEVVRDADVVLALDVTSFLSALGETDRSTREVRLLNEAAQVIAISLDDYAFRSWAHTFQSLVPGRSAHRRRRRAGAAGAGRGGGGAAGATAAAPPSGGRGRGGSPPATPRCAPSGRRR